MQKIKGHRILGFFPFYETGFKVFDWIQYMTYGIVFGLLFMIGIDTVFNTDLITSTLETSQAQETIYSKDLK